MRIFHVFKEATPLLCVGVDGSSPAAGETYKACVNYPFFH